MPELRIEPDGLTIDVAEGTALPRAAIAAGVPLELPCGGLGLCGKCRCEMIRGRVEPTADERRWLTPVELRDGLRLACRQVVDRDMTVVLSEDVRSRANQIMVGGAVRPTRVDSGVERVIVPIARAPLGDERDDWTRVQEALGRPISATLPALRQLPDALEPETGAITLTLVNDRAVAVAAGAVTGPPLGFAVDIGTTTVVCYLLDLQTGAELAHTAVLNPQVAYGDDVISRIHYASVERNGLRTLSLTIRRAIDQLVREACAQVGAEPSDLGRGAVVGNATMTHLFLGINPRGLGLAPFAPIFHDSVTAWGEELGLRATPGALVTVLPNIAGFLGSDTVGVILAAMPAPEETSLAVDIGTNGEMVLCHEGRWYGCSAAAGPAFEGARISCGMRGAEGAISRLEIVGDEVVLSVIENQAPRGLCGSGLLDSVAALLESGVLDVTGRYQSDGAVPAALAPRLSGEGNARSFQLALAEESATGEPLTLTGKDIREVQLAKSSIRASIEALMARAGVRAEDVRHIYLAGGFGSYLRVSSALRIGLLPPFEPERIVSVGNAAGAGARLALISRDELALAEELARRVEVLYLANDPVYQEHFMEQMLFP